MSIFQKVKVRDHSKVLMGQSPPSSVCKERGDGLPFIQGNAEFGERHPCPRLFCSAPARIAEPGDLLLSVRAPVGELNQASARTVIGRGLSALRFSPDTQAYAWHALKWSAAALNTVAQGSTFVAVNRQDVENLEIPWHGDANQPIAMILDMVDEAVAKSQAIIAKLKQVRAGLLHDLLTRGLDENGQLRPLPDDAPHIYQDSLLGRIPRNWSVRNVTSLAVNRDARRVPLKQADRDKRHGIYPYYGASGVIDFVDDYLFEGHFVLIGEDGENLRSRQLPLAFIVSGKFWVNNHAHVLEPLPDTDVQFLATVLEAQDYTPWLLGSAQPKLTQRNLEFIFLRIPQPHEQAQISNTLAAIENQIDAANREYMKLTSLKSGLTADLLTGRVRVPENIEIIAERQRGELNES